MYDKHNCNAQDDNQIPICPLCNHPVPIKPGESPDMIVSQHMDQNCKNPQNKLFTNRCSVLRCKNKELMKIVCENCGKNHCITHRHPTDHDCKAAPSSSTTGSKFTNQTAKKYYPIFNTIAQKSSTAFENIRSNISNSLSYDNIRNVSNSTFSGARSTSNVSSNNAVHNLQGDLTEEEALNIAIQESMSNNNSRAATSDTLTNQNKEKCRVS